MIRTTHGRQMLAVIDPRPLAPSVATRAHVRRRALRRSLLRATTAMSRPERCAVGRGRVDVDACAPWAARAGAVSAAALLALGMLTGVRATSSIARR
jgi:hypothetical protein